MSRGMVPKTSVVLYGALLKDRINILSIEQFCMYS